MNVGFSVLHSCPYTLADSPPTLWLSLHGHPSPACLLPLPCVSPAPFLPHSHSLGSYLFDSNLYSSYHLTTSCLIWLCVPALPQLSPYAHAFTPTLLTLLSIPHIKPSAARSVPCAGCSSLSKLPWLSGKSVASHVPDFQLCSSVTQDSFLMLQSSHVKSDVLHSH